MTSVCSGRLVARVRRWRGGSRGIHADLTPRPNQHLAGEHDAFVGGDSLGHNHVIALALPQPHGPEFNCIVGFQHVDERPLLTDLCGLIRN